jgi:hypothetical protein
MDKKTMKKTVKNKRLENLKPWQTGESGNPNGRPRGVRNFKTIFEEAAKEVAEALRLGKKPDAVKVELVKRGIREGLSGKYPFYKDLMDRLFGETTQRIKHEGAIEIEQKPLTEEEKKEVKELDKLLKQYVRKKKKPSLLDIERKDKK